MNRTIFSIVAVAATALTAVQTWAATPEDVDQSFFPYRNWTPEFPGLAPGNYTVTASLEGMQTMRQENIALLVGQTLDVNFEMGVETVTEAITGGCMSTEIRPSSVTKPAIS